jgi:PPOX class probable F420-dependent enzyme
MDGAALESLAGQSYINLVTFRRNGKPVETPVWFAERDGSLFVFSAGDAGKMKRLRNDARVRVAACGVRGARKGPWIEATARRVEDAETIRAAYDSLLRKYGWQMRLTNWLSGLTGRIEQRAVLEIQ